MNVNEGYLFSFNIYFLFFFTKVKLVTICMGFLGILCKIALLKSPGVNFFVGKFCNVNKEMIHLSS